MIGKKKKAKKDDLVPPPLGEWRDFRPGLLDYAANAAIWGVGAGWLAGMTGLMNVLHKTVGPERIEPVSRLFCRGMVATTGARWKAYVDPAVKDDEVYVFAQNHINHFDFVSMYPATPHFKQGLELETHFKYPIYGPYMRDRGTIPVQAKREGRLDDLRPKIKAEVERGHSILAFPEGTRTLDGRVGAFRRGVFVIARDLGLKVVPTAVTGMYDIMRKGSLIIRPRRTVKVFCDAPVDFAGVSDADLAAKIEEVRGAIARRVDDSLGVTPEEAAESDRIAAERERRRQEERARKAAKTHAPSARERA